MPFKLAKQRECEILWLAGFGEQEHMGLFRRSSPFFSVTISACRHDIVPDGFSSLRARNNVVKGKVDAAGLYTTILTYFVVTCEDSPS
jgi:hypothetical protein